MSTDKLNVASEGNNQSTVQFIQETTRRFLNREKLGGLLLMAATILALVIGNSAWATDYHHYLEDEFSFELSGHFTFSLTVEEWINDGLMIIFFLVMGLELKREILVGELSSLKKASMPLMGALGGMVVPALIFFIFNVGTETAHGWGIPIATDIAYSLGIIGLLGKRIPTQLKVFLVALAVADDLGAILMIAVFYSNQLDWIYLGSAIAIFILLLICNRMKLKKLFWYLLGSVALWYCFLHSGVHPTIAGVLLAIAIPFKPILDSESLKERTKRNLEALNKMEIEGHNPLQNKKHREILHTMKKDANKSRPPLLKLENSLVDFNAYFVIPVFALANAGVKLDFSLAEIFTDTLGLGILLGLAVGKVTGIGLFSYLGAKLGLAQLDSSLSWRHLVGIGFIAGIGFTMSLFITNLAFVDADFIKVSKISVLLASLISAVAGIIMLLLYTSKTTK